MTRSTPASKRVATDERSSARQSQLQTDHLGTVRDVVNNSGAVQNHIQYDAFGRRIGETSAALRC